MAEKELKGLGTALITPFTSTNGIDYDGLKQLVEFQIANGTKILVPCGTTGETPTLEWPDNIEVITKVLNIVGDRALVVAGIGSNSTGEMVHAADRLMQRGILPCAVMAMEPYYNKPDSRAIRRHFKALATVVIKYGVSVVVYTIPTRTGCQIMPIDLGILARRSPNVIAVKEATGDSKNMTAIRKECGPDFIILSGNDGDTYKMFANHLIIPTGCISVVSNVFPRHMAAFVEYLLNRKTADALRIHKIMETMFNAVSITTTEDTPRGQVVCKTPNPVPIKTLMQILGMPSGQCRKPLEPLTKKGFDILITAAQTVYNSAPNFYDPIREFFWITDIEDRLNNPKRWTGLYDQYYCD